eukprot:TRINITY_DN11086_c2_g2_i1.p1 TRINITY_DN11086_c2_g2~~TRINITY_DN11086_c2_g2_i1.p1  ORF type:complete len:824 (+),score=190.01 TRINITY_DN11086_c2_g2_i1:179-2650(+)
MPLAAGWSFLGSAPLIGSAASSGSRKRRVSDAPASEVPAPATIAAGSATASGPRKRRVSDAPAPEVPAPAATTAGSAQASGSRKRRVTETPVASAEVPVPAASSGARCSLGGESPATSAASSGARRRRGSEAPAAGGSLAHPDADAIAANALAESSSLPCLVRGCRQRFASSRELDEHIVEKHPKSKAARALAARPPSTTTAAAAVVDRSIEAVRAEVEAFIREHALSQASADELRLDNELVFGEALTACAADSPALQQEDSSTLDQESAERNDEDRRSVAAEAEGAQAAAEPVLSAAENQGNAETADRNDDEAPPGTSADAEIAQAIDDLVVSMAEEQRSEEVVDRNDNERQGAVAAAAGRARLIAKPVVPAAAHQRTEELDFLATPGRTQDEHVALQAVEGAARSSTEAFGIRALPDCHVVPSSELFLQPKAQQSDTPGRLAAASANSASPSVLDEPLRFRPEALRSYKPAAAQASNVPPGGSETQLPSRATPQHSDAPDRPAEASTRGAPPADAGTQPPLQTAAQQSDAPIRLAAAGASGASPVCLEPLRPVAQRADPLQRLAADGEGGRAPTSSHALLSSRRAVHQPSRPAIQQATPASASTGGPDAREVDEMLALEAELEDERMHLEAPPGHAGRCTTVATLLLGAGDASDRVVSSAAPCPRLVEGPVDLVRRSTAYSGQPERSCMTAVAAIACAPASRHGGLQCGACGDGPDAREVDEMLALEAELEEERLHEAQLMATQLGARSAGAAAARPAAPAPPWEWQSELDFSDSELLVACEEAEKLADHSWRRGGVHTGKLPDCPRFPFPPRERECAAVL